MTPRDIQIDDFTYPLPEERIAKHPLAERDACLLAVWQPDEPVKDAIFNQLPSLLPSNAVMVRNNTRVINARLKFHKTSGAAIEIFCLEPHAPADYAQNFAATDSCTWICLVGNSKKWKDGSLELNIGDNVLKATRVAAAGNAWIIRFEWTGAVPFSEIISEAGEIPVPPYLNRATEQSDFTDYQTIYANIEGSVAAPTAGLHFTPSVFKSLADRGVELLDVTLHVGAGTFQPVKTRTIGDHPMHSEFIAVESPTVARLHKALEEGRPIIAIGTTSVRTLESLYHIGCMMAEGRWRGEVEQWYPYSENHPRLSAAAALKSIGEWLETHNLTTLIADTRLIIAPGYEFKIVDGIVTNFHQPLSTLLLLVSAFMGAGQQWRGLYDHALAGDYRFLSYGDACLLTR